MQVRCKVYGFANASAGVECVIEQDLLKIGECLHHNDRDYVIVSVVEGQGCWFANVVPEYQRQLMRRALSQSRSQEEVEKLRESLDEWRYRAEQAENTLQTLHDEQRHFGERLDHLMQMLEHVAKGPDMPQPAVPPPLIRRKGSGEHVR